MTDRRSHAIIKKMGKVLKLILVLALIVAAVNGPRMGLTMAAAHAAMPMTAMNASAMGDCNAPKGDCCHHDKDAPGKACPGGVACALQCASLSFFPPVVPTGPVRSIGAALKVFPTYVRLESGPVFPPFRPPPTLILT